MNIGSKTSNGLLYTSFNQDASCLSVASRSGYKIYNCDPFGRCYTQAAPGIGIAEMLFCTSLIALVGAGEHPSFSPRKLQIINTRRQTTICELTYPFKVLAVKLNRKRLVVVLEEQIYIYDISNMKLLHTLDTIPNQAGLCVLSSDPETGLVAFPSNAANSPGDVLLFNVVTLQPLLVIPAHKTHLACLVFDPNARLLATASDKGTVIRVFDVQQGTLKRQFRRGAREAKIRCLCFSKEADMLAVASDTDTIHIYKLDQPEKQSSYLDSITSPIAAYLPSNLTDIWEAERHYAFVKVKMEKGSMVSCAFGSEERRILNVVTSEGDFYCYSIEEGECSLLKTSSILED